MFLFGTESSSLAPTESTMPHIDQVDDSMADMRSIPDLREETDKVLEQSLDAAHVHPLRMVLAETAASIKGVLLRAAPVANWPSATRSRPRPSPSKPSSSTQRTLMLSEGPSS